MSHPDLLFMKALRCFKKLMLLANVFHDRPVPYCTAAVQLENPYEKSPPVPIDPKYPSIVTTIEAIVAREVASKDRQQAPSVSRENQPAVMEAAVTQPPVPRRPLRNAYLPLLFIFFLPLALPALLFMVITGRQHHCKITRTALDFSWIQRHYHKPSGKTPSPDLQMTLSEETVRVDNGPVSTAIEATGAVAATAAAITRLLDGLPSDIECPSAPDVPLRRSNSKALAAAASAGSGAESSSGFVATAKNAAPASSTALGALDDGDDGVVVSEQTVLLRDGIVELPAEVHGVQEWLVKQVRIAGRRVA